MNTFRSILAIVVAFLMFIIAIPLIAILVIISFGYLQNWVIENFGKIIGRGVLATAGIKMDIKQIGEPVDQPVIYLINHSSTLDMFVIIGLGLPRVRFLAKYELQFNPIFYLVGNLTGQIFIVRQKSEKAIQKIKKAYKKIKRNRLSILVAPEGSRKHEGIIGPFKKGAFRMAMDLNYPIVPIYTAGADELCERDSIITKPGI
ncbi:MAG TPA: lysophospholipid acyltransferase family protein, partial [Balneolales bacterium]|nr:lysophospholipid acyltransferase family protein [Balneolales bacterium]